MFVFQILVLIFAILILLYLGLPDAVRARAFEEVDRLRTFGWYQPSELNPSKLVFVQPKVVKNMDEIRAYVTMGYNVYKKNGRYYANVIREDDTSFFSSDEDDDDTNERNGQLSSIAVVNRRAPTSQATVSDPDFSTNMHGNQNEGGQVSIDNNSISNASGIIADHSLDGGELEFIDDDTSDFVEVEDDGTYEDPDEEDRMNDSATLNFYLSDDDSTDSTLENIIVVRDEIELPRIFLDRPRSNFLIFIRFCILQFLELWSFQHDKYFATGRYPKRDRSATKFYGHVWPSDFPVPLWFNEKVKNKKQKLVKESSVEEKDEGYNLLLIIVYPIHNLIGSVKEIKINFSFLFLSVFQKQMSLFSLKDQERN